MEDLHVSGHGSQADMMLLLSSLAPRWVVPIGGTYKHLMQYKRLAQDIGYDARAVLVPGDGETIEFRPDSPPQVVEKLELANVMVDGLGVGDVGAVVLRDRQTIAKEGIVLVVIPIELSTGRVIGKPQITSRGFIYMRESGKILMQASGVVMRSLRLKKGGRFDWQFARKRIEEALGSYFLQATGRSPLVVPVIIEV